MRVHLFNMAAGGRLRFVTKCNTQVRQKVELQLFVPTIETEVIQEYVCLCLTVRNKPASSSRDEDIKLEVCSRMRPRVQPSHPTYQKHIKLLCVMRLGIFHNNFTALHTAGSQKLLVRKNNC